MWWCLWVPKNFPVILPEKWWWKCWFGVGTVGEDERIWEKCLGCVERKWKRKKTIEVSRPKSKEISEWVVGSGVRWGLSRGNPNLILTSSFLFIYFNIMLTGTLHFSFLDRHNYTGESSHKDDYENSLWITIYNNEINFKTPFFLIDKLSSKVILGNPFLALL